MKKFYTLLSVALLATGLLSAASRELKNSEIKIAPLSKQEVLNAFPNIDAIEAQLKANKVAKAPNRIKDPNAPTVTLSDGDYILLTADDDTKENPSIACMGTFSMSKTDDGYLVKDFLKSFGESLGATEYYDINASLGTELVQTTTYYKLSFPGRSKVFKTADNKIYELLCYGPFSVKVDANGKPILDDKGQYIPDPEYHLYTDDIDFLYLAEYDALIFWFTKGGFWLATIDADGNASGYQFLQPEFDFSDIKMVCTEYVTEEETVQVTYPLSGGLYKDDQNNYSFGLWNFGGAEEQVMLSFNPVNETATGTDQLYAVRTTQTGQTYNFYLTTEESLANNENIIVGNIGTDATNRTTITFPGAIAAYSAEAKQSFTYFEDAVVTFDYNIYGEDVEGGVENVIADSDVNAPVEYYNLQGMRVANPEAGQLVIKRQGKTVSKIVVR